LQRRKSRQEKKKKEYQQNAHADTYKAETLKKEVSKPGEDRHRKRGKIKIGPLAKRKSTAWNYPL